MVKAFSGREKESITFEEIIAGNVSREDVRIHASTLRHQARVAESQNNSQLADNFLRAAELTTLTDTEILALYEALRPGRATKRDLQDMVNNLRERGLPRTAALVAEAADVGDRRQFLKK